MSLKTEQRWQCDYCRQVSPVILPGTEPRGWIMFGERVTEAVFGMAVSGQVWRHFCCDAHYDAWWDERHKQHDKVPD